MTDDYLITLKDVFGTKVGSTTYYVASGDYVDMQVREITLGYGLAYGDSTAANKIIGENTVAEDGTSTSTGAGSLTDSSKNWITNQWAYYKLKDAAGTSPYPTITSNTATVLTLSSGTPVAGDYQILAPITSFNDRKPRLQYVGLNPPVVDLSIALDMLSPRSDTTVNGNTVKALTFKILWDFLTTPNTYFLKDYLGSSTSVKTPINTLINNTDIFNTTNPKVYSANGMPVKLLNVSIPRDTSTDDNQGVTSFKLSLMETRI